MTCSTTPLFTVVLHITPFYFLHLLFVTIYTAPPYLYIVLMFILMHAVTLDLNLLFFMKNELFRPMTTSGLPCRKFSFFSFFFMYGPPPPGPPSQLATTSSITVISYLSLPSVFLFILSGIRSNWVYIAFYIEKTFILFIVMFRHLFIFIVILLIICKYDITTAITFCK